MPPRPARMVLSLEAAALAGRTMSGAPTLVDLSLRRGEVALVHVDDDAEAFAMVDLCVGMTAPATGHVRFLGVDWATRNRPERLRRRQRIGVVVQTDVWPSQMTIMESILLAQLHHSGRSRDELVAQATELARQFGLPGLPAEGRDATQRQALLRAGCIRGFLGAPDLVLVHDALLDHASELAVPMAQAISATRARGGAVLWVSVGAAAVQAIQFVEADQIHRLGDAGLVRMRRSL
jgi:phospholipid/cholesterol/gamma-HCH transport system ATP-binding protein